MSLKIQIDSKDLSEIEFALKTVLRKIRLGQTIGLLKGLKDQDLGTFRS